MQHWYIVVDVVLILPFSSFANFDPFNSSGSKPALSLGIAHNYGAVWDISWCPSGTWEPESSRKNEVSAYARHGVKL